MRAIYRACAAALCIVLLCMAAGCAKKDTSAEDNAYLSQSGFDPVIRIGDKLYFLNEGYLYRADIRTSETELACSNKNCAHNTVNCEAFLAANRFMLSNGRFYWISRDNGGYKLMSQSAEGKDRREDMQLDGDLEGTHPAGFSGIYEGKLVRAAAGAASEGGYFGDVTVYTQTIGGDSRPKVLFRVSTGEASGIDYMPLVLARMQGGKLYCSVFSEERLNAYEVDISSGAHRKIYDGEAPSAAYMYAEEGRLVFSGAGTVFELDISSGNLSTLKEYSGYTAACPEAVFVFTSGGEYRCEAADGSLLFEGVFECEGFDESEYYKDYLGASEGVMYFRFSSYDEDPRVYIVSFDTASQSAKLLWTNNPDPNSGR